MADTASIAIRRDQALARMKTAMERIGGKTGVQPVALPQYDPDRNYLEAWRLDVLAGYAEQVADALDSAPEPKHAELEAAIETATITLSSADLETLLDGGAVELANGATLAVFTEEEQAETPLTAEALLAELNALDKEAALERAESAGLKRTSRTSKQEAIDFLLAAAGFSEDEQAAADAAEGV
jgi:hypothetical protein